MILPPVIDLLLDGTDSLYTIPSSQVKSLYRIMAKNLLQEKQRVALLLDWYGDLLTERQKHFLELYCNEDLSYTEIAENEGISRQAVHDAIQHGKKTLFKLERHLHLTRNDVPPVISQVQDGIMIPQENWDMIRNKIESLYQYFCHNDIIYDTGPIVKQCQELLSLLKAGKKT
jgi:predicted DNA-binding protein YlxM (UPF0122 family)